MSTNAFRANGYLRDVVNIMIFSNFVAPPSFIKILIEQTMWQYLPGFS